MTMSTFPCYNTIGKNRYFKNKFPLALWQRNWLLHSAYDNKVANKNKRTDLTSSSFLSVNICVHHSYEKGGFFVTFSLFTWLKQVFLWRAGFYPANQNDLKSIQKALIDWKKAGPPKKPLLFWSCKQAILQNFFLIFQNRCRKFMKNTDFRWRQWPCFDVSSQ